MLHSVIVYALQFKDTGMFCVDPGGTRIDFDWNSHMMEGGTPDNRRAVYVEKRFERFIADRYNLPTYMQKDGDGNSWWRKKHEMFWGNQSKLTSNIFALSNFVLTRILVCQFAPTGNQITGKATGARTSRLSVTNSATANATVMMPVTVSSTMKSMT